MSLIKQRMLGSTNLNQMDLIGIEYALFTYWLWLKALIIKYFQNYLLINCLYKRKNHSCSFVFFSYSLLQLFWDTMLWYFIFHSIWRKIKHKGYSMFCLYFYIFFVYIFFFPLDAMHYHIFLLSYIFIY